MEQNSARETKLEIIEVFPADLMKDFLNRSLKGKLGCKEEEEEEEAKEWTDYEKLFTLVILPTYLQRAGDPGRGKKSILGWGYSPASIGSQRKVARVKITSANLGYPNRRYQEVPPQKT